MSELEAALIAVLAGVRDWATLLFAFLAAGYGWKIDRDRQRDRSVLVDGLARPVSGKTLRVDIDIRNRSRQMIRVLTVEVVRPAPSILAMEGVHEPGPGPIRCHHLVPAESRGALSFLMGSPGLTGGPGRRDVIRVRCAFKPHPGRLAFVRRRIVVIDPDLLPVEPFRPVHGDRDVSPSVDDGVNGNQ